MGKIERHLKNEAITRHNQQGLMKGKNCVSSLISYNKVSHLVVGDKAMNVTFLDFNNTFDGILHSILLVELFSCEMNKKTLHCMNWLKNRVKRDIVNGLKSVMVSH